MGCTADSVVTDAWFGMTRWPALWIFARDRGCCVVRRVHAPLPTIVIAAPRVADHGDRNGISIPALVQCSVNY
jgi:hypothetical protein